MTYDFKLKNGREPTATEMLSLRVEADLYADQILAQPQEEGDDDDHDHDDDDDNDNQRDGEEEDADDEEEEIGDGDENEILHSSITILLC